jgi:hypothetical protein
MGRLGWPVLQQVKAKRRLGVVVVGVTVIAAARLQLHVDSTMENEALEERRVKDEEVGIGDGVEASVVVRSCLMRWAAVKVWAQ